MVVRVVVIGPVVLVVAAAVGVVVGARALQHRIAYFPDLEALPPAAVVLPGAQDVTLTTSDGLRLVAWFVPPNPRVPVRDQAVLVAHGNAGSLSGRAQLASALADRGFAVLLVGYRGFSQNPGTPSQKGLVRDALAAQQELAARGFGPDKTIYFGESIGTGVVTALAAQVPPAGLVLRSPFTSLHDVGTTVIPVPALVSVVMNRNAYPVATQLAAIDVPTTVLYGTCDETVPACQSEAVAAAALDLFEEVAVPGAGHNNALWMGPTVADGVVRLADSVRG